MFRYCGQCPGVFKRCVVSQISPAIPSRIAQNTAAASRSASRFRLNSRGTISRSAPTARPRQSEISRQRSCKSGTKIASSNAPATTANTPRASRKPLGSRRNTAINFQTATKSRRTRRTKIAEKRNAAAGPLRRTTPLCLRYRCSSLKVFICEARLSSMD